MNIWNRFLHWMSGRYGMDQLGMGLAGSYFILGVLSSFTRFFPLTIISYLLLLLCLYRMFSKNISQRYKENAKFLSLLKPLQNRSLFVKRSLTERQTHRFFVCKQCGQTIRVPKGKGKIEITCPKCHNRFVKKT